MHRRCYALSSCPRTRHPFQALAHASQHSSRLPSARDESFLLACLESKTQVQSGRSPSTPESLFSCVAKRKVTQREGHPAWRLPGILPGKSVSRSQAFRQDSCPDEKELTSMSTPCGPVDPNSPPHRGPGRAAGHRGPHFSEEPEQSKAKLGSTISTAYIRPWVIVHRSSSRPNVFDRWCPLFRRNSPQTRYAGVMHSNRGFKGCP